MNYPLISIVSPIYGCKTCLIEFYFRLKEILEKITNDFEIILVNDASPDDAWETIIELAQKDSRVKGINLSRNFGQHYAITAGLDHCKGDWVVIMDCDLQDQPEEIPKLLNKAKDGFDIVLGKRIYRKDRFFKKALSFLYYKLLSYFTDNKIDATVGSFRIMSRQVVENFKKMNEKLRFFGAMVNWLGFNVGFVEIEHAPRKKGESSYNYHKMLKLGINGILSFSDKPLRLTIKMGISLILISSIYILFKVTQILLFGTQAIGWTSLIAAIFFSTGLIISVLGIVGLYIGRIFEEVKGRPLYVIKNEINMEI
jgi:polyisoprenyl-phosphate glycosyltransferase